jgi:hypothetical protein
LAQRSSQSGKITSIYENFFRDLGLGIAGIKEVIIKQENILKELPPENVNDLKKRLKNGTYTTFLVLIKPAIVSQRTETGTYNSIKSRSPMK